MKGFSKKITAEASEEYKDSLEIVNKSPIHGSEKLKGQFDTVELDSLEITKIDSINLNAATTEQFYPFAKIGTKWSNDEAAAQNSITAIHFHTNPDVENNTTNEFAQQTNSNNSISTNQMVDEDMHDLPGTSDGKLIKLLAKKPILTNPLNSFD